MSAASTLHRTYWRVFNVLVRVVSIVFVLGAVTTLLRASFGQEKVVLWSLVLSLVLGGLGALMLRAPAFRPDIDGYGAAFFKNRAAEPRRWWTGDLIQGTPVPPNNSLEQTHEG